jgi:hypothetical protein
MGVEPKGHAQWRTMSQWGVILILSLNYFSQSLIQTKEEEDDTQIPYHMHT